MTPPSLPLQRLRLAVAAALLGWAVFGFLLHATKAAAAWRDRDSYATGSANWRFDTRQVGRLRRCLSSSLEVIPPDARIAVAARAPDIYFWRWAAYFLPHRDVLPAPAVPPVEGSDYLIAFGTEWPEGELLRGGRWCGVYRLPR
jgi:hypothetical protein